MKIHKLNTIVIQSVLTVAFSTVALVGQAQAATTAPGCGAGSAKAVVACENKQNTTTPTATTAPASNPGDVCGGGYDNNGTPYVTVKTSIDLGCTGKGNPITDLTFAIIRLLSDGVGIVIVASIIVGGIQYSVSRGDPNASAAAITRIRTALIALLIFIFAYAILNYVIPNGFFNQ